MTRAYFASLADYNAGRLVGTWVELGTGIDVDDVQQHITTMLRTSKEPFAQEWAIHDYEGFGPYKVHEWHDLEELCAIAQVIAERGLAPVSHALTETPADTLRQWLDDHYCGTYDSPADYAASLFDAHCGAVPDVLRPHIDWQSVARDLGFDGYHFETIAWNECLVFSP